MKYKNRVKVDINDLSFNIMKTDYEKLTIKQIDIINRYDEEQNAKSI